MKSILQLIQSNLNICPKTKINILWENVTNGIKISEKDFNYLGKFKNIKKLEYIENGCWLIYNWDIKYWYKFGKLHREDGPAIERSNGDKEYYINGKRHREDGPAIEWANGDKSYYINGKLHREDGPAIERSNGEKSYWINGKLRREDGPAIEYSDGTKSYYINGEYYLVNNYWEHVKEREIKCKNLHK